MRFKGDVTSEQVRDAARSAGFEDASVQRFGPTGSNQFLVQTRAVSVVNQAKITQVVGAVGAVAPIVSHQWSEEQPDRLDVEFSAPLDEATQASIIQTITTQGELEGVEIERRQAAGESAYVIRFQELAKRVSEGFAKEMPEAFDKQTGLDRLESVGARVGNQLREDGMTAVLLALVAILIYIAVRFDIRYAPGAVVALFHDVIISIGILTITQMEINLPILASILTIVGYSLNDTIVVFDRIRENVVAGVGGASLKEIINTSLNETLSRTLITSLTTLFAVIMIYAFGSGLIENFAFTLIIGVCVGTYSSIAIASPILLIMDNWLRNQQRAKELRQGRTAGATSPDVTES